MTQEGVDSSGKIKDYISGQWVKATPEEVEAVQEFSRILVEVYGYPKSHIRTRPQWKVKARPSDSRREYPVDIAIFGSEEHSEDNIHIVVECKRKNKADGRSQLEDYLRLSKAEVGVWFNGEERLFLRKYEKSGKVYFEEIPNIPNFGQRVEDVGKFKKEDLRPADNLRSVFRAARNYLAANAVGITRDEVFAQQIINLLFCKIYDEKYTRQKDMVTFRAGLGESDKDVSKRIHGLFEHVKKTYEDVINVDDEIRLDQRSLSYVVGEMQIYSLTQSGRDAVADAFEIFIGPSLKGSQGQFFTPRNVVKMVVDIIDPGMNDRILDPACGSGGFLVEALRHVWTKVDDRGNELSWPEDQINTEKQQIAFKNFYGMDKDDFLSKVAKAYMAILGDGRGGVHCENSLDRPEKWDIESQNDIKLNHFDVVITNPPFGKKLAIDSEEMLSKYDLGHDWRKRDDKFEKKGVADKRPPQILFIERAIEFLKPGGKLGIVLLESIFGMPKYEYIVDYLKRNYKIKAVVTLPEDLFQPYTHAKTCVLVLEKQCPSDSDQVFMADVKWCGHDSRGNPTYTTDENGDRVLLDEVPLVAEEYWNGGVQ